MASRRTNSVEPEQNNSDESESLGSTIPIKNEEVDNDRNTLTYAVQGISEQLKKTRTDGQPIGLLRSQRGATPEILLWHIIKRSTASLSFKNYKAFMDYTLCWDPEDLLKLEPDEQNLITTRKREEYIRLKGESGAAGQRYLPFTDTDAYRYLKVATEAFLIVNCGVPLLPPDETQSPPFSGTFTEKDYQDLLNQLELFDISKKTVNDWWSEYLITVNGADGYVMPYLTIIKNKLSGLHIKNKIFAGESPSAYPDDLADEEERCYGILMNKLFQPCLIELIWSYWHEQGMMVQTMNALSKRFQNVRGPTERDPLAMVELDPLRPLNNLLWGYIQDEQHRLTVLRRADEYDHHYRLTLDGKAIPAMRTADSRSKFIEAFHHLLYLTAVFYKQDNDTTVIADAYPLLMGLRDLHLILSEGAHNQYGDLPSTARIEMLTQQWLLGRPEFREVLPTRVMVAYPEPWMDRVDAMKRLQGWNDISSMHFHNLGVYGEQILLTVRFTRWSEIEEEDLAAAWARMFRSQVQGYIQAYLTVTGADLAAEVATAQQREQFTAQPSKLLTQRQRIGSTLPISHKPVHQTFHERRAERR